MFCPHCGTQTANDARFCVSCGRSLSNSQAAPPPPSSLEPSTAHAPSTGVLRSGTLPANVATLEAVAAVPVIQYAGFWRRAAALVLDVVILYIVAAIVGVVLNFLYAVLGARSAAADLASGLIVLLWFAISILYFPLQESSAAQATLGKRAVSIKVTDLEGRRIGFWKALWRHVAKSLSYVTLGIGYLMAAFTARKQALHDMLAGCLVVRA